MKIQIKDPQIILKGSTTENDIVGCQIYLEGRRQEVNGILTGFKDAIHLLQIKKEKIEESINDEKQEQNRTP